MGVVIEFCGLPGAGKSYVACRTVAGLRRAGFAASDTNLTIGPGAPRLPRLTKKLARMTAELTWSARERALGVDLRVAASQTDTRDRFARPLNLLVARQLVRRSTHLPGYHALDQAVVQEWWSAALRADRPRVIAAMRRSLPSSPLPHFLVHVVAPLDVLVDRLRHRRTRESRIERQDARAVTRELEDGQRLLEQVLSTVTGLPDSTRPRLLTVNGHDPHAARDVVEWLVDDASAVASALT